MRAHFTVLYINEQVVFVLVLYYPLTDAVS
jgi:hypothetical protein